MEDRNDSGDAPGSLLGAAILFGLIGLAASAEEASAKRLADEAAVGKRRRQWKVVTKYSEGYDDAMAIMLLGCLGNQEWVYTLENLATGVRKTYRDKEEFEVGHVFTDD